MEGIKVKTTYGLDFVKQSVDYGLDDLLAPIARKRREEILNLKEQGIRDALKSLGWVSPEEAKQQQTIIKELVGALGSLINKSHYHRGVDMKIKSIESQHRRDNTQRSVSCGQRN